MDNISSSVKDKRENHFISELCNVRERINGVFSDLIARIEARKSELLAELDNLIESYKDYQSEFENWTPCNESNNFDEAQLNDFRSELESIESRVEPKMIHFVCDKYKMFTAINNFGKLAEKNENYITYENKRNSILSFCRKGSGMDQLNYPWGVTIDNRTGNIYVADQFNHSIKVHASTGEFLSKFGDSYGEGRMEFPKCLIVFEDRILITHECLTLHSSDYNILDYKLNGKFISKIGSIGKGKLEFDFPCGIACNTINGDVYVSDSNNDRIQVLSKKLTFKSQFGPEKLKSPLDIKLSEEYIFILDRSNPCIHLYNYDYTLQKSFVSRGEDMQVIKPYCFFIDNAGNLLITDRSSKSVLIFNHELELDHKINTSLFPMGVTVDNLKRVIVVCRSREDCLQIF